MDKNPKLKEPIEILISARNSGGLLCSVARWLKYILTEKQY